MKNISNLYKINPYYITGFTEADGCFYIYIKTDYKSKFGLSIIPIFYITQDIKSSHVLFNIHKTLFQTSEIKSLNFIKRLSDNTLTYRVSGIKNCYTIIKHFSQYPLVGEKQKNFLIFKLI
jgi:hypothetical protein